uniref:Ig-like domain-containing protein n=1 Tax=Parastrongyloides trichosuri TaxID=131310 RepID=A0A0N5A3Z4_PARTI
MRRLARASNLSLTIHSVTEADKGIYQCIVTKYNSNGLNERLEGEKIHAIVHFKPIILFPKSGAVEEFHFMNIGQSFSYECKIQSLPLAEISWMKDDQIISNTANLSFPILKPEHQGTYTCVAINVDGMEKSNLRLVLSRSPIIDTILQNKTVVEGESINWKCKAQAIPNNLTYEWLFEEKEIRKQELGLRTKILSEGEILISNITKNDNGKYTCVVKNGIQEAIKMDVHLNVLYKPFLQKNEDVESGIKTIIEGNDDLISCNFISNPPIHQIIWTKNGIAIPNNSNNILNIKNANENDSGIYSCQGLNELGQSLPYEIHVIVISLPRFTKTPPPKYTINKGDNLILECDGFASPPPLQYWLRNGKRTYSSKIVINRVNHDDHGIYECILSNQDLMVKKTTEVLVLNVKPQPCVSVQTDCQFYPKIVTTLSWIPGFNGGRSQNFKLYWRDKMSDHWFTTDTTSFLNMTFDNFNKFTEYEIKIESQNMFGKVISPTFKIHSCSILVPPTKLELENNLRTLVWDKVEDAEKYKISYRTEKMKSFETLSVVTYNNYTLPDFFNHQRNSQIYIQSLRFNYQDSAPSSTITINSTNFINGTFLFILTFGGIILFIFLFIIYVYRRKCNGMFKYFSNAFYPNKVPIENINKCTVIETSSCGSKSSWNFQQLPYEYVEELQRERLMMNNACRNHFINQPSNENTLSSKINHEWLLHHINNFNHCPSSHRSTSSSSIHTISQTNRIFSRPNYSDHYNNRQMNHELHNIQNYIPNNQEYPPCCHSSTTVLTESPIITMMKDKYIHSSGGTIDRFNYLQELRVKQLKYEYNHNNTTFTEEKET